MSFFIKDFEFFDLRGFPDRLKQNVALEARAGVDGHALWLLGTRGTPFQITSLVDCATLGDAIDLLADYQAIIGESVNVTWASYEFPLQFDVLSVIAIPDETGGVIRTSLSVGGLEGATTGGALLVCSWALVATTSAREV